MPSPHISEHTSGAVLEPPIHRYPASTFQLLSHPSPLILLPSSQPVELVRNPLPQMSLHDDCGLVRRFVVHVKPDSSEQVKLQPSPEITFPSSHCSNAAEITPSPHTVLQVQLISRWITQYWNSNMQYIILQWKRIFGLYSFDLLYKMLVTLIYHWITFAWLY